MASQKGGRALLIISSGGIPKRLWLKLHEGEVCSPLGSEGHDVDVLAISARARFRADERSIVPRQ